MRSKGVSQIVASVLIVLIVLVASGMMWIVIQTFLSNTSDRVGGVDCFSAAVQPVSCVYDSDTRGVSVIVHRDLGVSSISGLNFVFSNSTGSFVNQKISDIQELETRNYTFYYPQNFIIPNQVDVSAKLGDLVCNPSQQPIICNEGDVAAEQNCNVHEKYACTTNDGKPGLKECLDGVDYGDCNVACGDGFVEPLLGEECDASDPNDPNKDKCTNECKLQADNGDWGPILDDCGALYSNDQQYDRGNLKVIIDNNGANGQQNFQVVRGDGTVLRRENANDIFVGDHNSKLLVTYQISAGDKCPNSGVDIKFTVTNNGNGPLALPTFFQIPGIMQTVDKNKEGYYLYDNDYGGMKRMIKDYQNNGNFKSAYLGGLTQGTNEVDRFQWPGVYSPVIVTHDDSFSVGSSLMYDYLSYKHAVIMTLRREGDGSWTHRYSDFINEANNGSIRLAKGEKRTYTISLRFTRPDSYYWLYTLAPYKQYFDQQYSARRVNEGYDLRPIRGIRLSAADNPQNAVNVPSSLAGRFYASNHEKKDGTGSIRGYLKDGWDNFLNAFIANAQNNGYTRTMIGVASGQYDPAVTANCIDGNGKSDTACNFPPQPWDFVNVLKPTAPFSKFSQKGLSFGLWWGRASQVAYSDIGGKIFGEDDWNPLYVKLVDFNSQDEKDFYNRQLDAALNRNINILGVDGFLGAAYEKYHRIQYFRDRATFLGKPQPFIITEGSQSDFVHSLAATYYSPCKHDFLLGPDALSYYLNPNQEIWVQFASTFNYIDDNGNSVPICDKNYNSLADSEVQKHVRWGYTRIFNNYNINSDVNLLSQGYKNFEFRPNSCFDHLDNDGDDLVDFPFDPDCTSFVDDDELVK